MVELYGKESHREALRSAQILKSEYGASFQEQPLQTRVFRANALDGKEMLKHVPPQSVDMVITDIPYGEHSRWEESGSKRAGVGDAGSADRRALPIQHRGDRFKQAAKSHPSKLPTCGTIPGWKTAGGCFKADQPMIGNNPNTPTIVRTARN